jgi:hypothetical protein
MSAHQADEALEAGASPGQAREWACLACSGASGEGVQAGVEWLVAAAKRAAAVKRGKAKQPAAAPAAEPEPALEAEQPRSSSGGGV